MASKGFAALSKERKAEISRMGGRASHARGTAHEWTKEEAAVAGRKGGLAAGKRHAFELPGGEPEPELGGS
jgi:general stress protein YciG